MSSNPNQGKNEVTQRVELGQDEQILGRAKRDSSVCCQDFTAV